MKRITILILTFLLLCGLLSGCITAAAEEETTSAATVPAETTVEIPAESSPLLTPSLPIETIPENTDDSDYQLPPGENPTIEPEVK